MSRTNLTQMNIILNSAEEHLRNQHYPIMKIPPNTNDRKMKSDLKHCILAIEYFLHRTLELKDMEDAMQMLVLLENKRRRLITFTLDHAVHIRQLLVRCELPALPETNIKVFKLDEYPNKYIVVVGNVNLPESSLFNNEVKNQIFQPIPDPRVMRLLAKCLTMRRRLRNARRSSSSNFDINISFRRKIKRNAGGRRLVRLRKRRNLN